MEYRDLAVAGGGLLTVGPRPFQTRG
jgi:hypothetical protein